MTITTRPGLKKKVFYQKKNEIFFEKNFFLKTPNLGEMMMNKTISPTHLVLGEKLLT
jgi:hypothetical protein